MSRDPERELVRRAAPYVPLAFVLALLLGGLFAGWPVGWSAAIGVLLVAANSALNAEILARTARVSLVAYSAGVMGGFVLRLGAIVAAMFGLNRLSWFSPLAFGLAVIPATALLLGYEMKLIAGGLGAELRIPPEETVRRG